MTYEKERERERDRDFSLQTPEEGGTCKREMILIFERVRSVITPKQVDNQISLLTC